MIDWITARVAIASSIHLRTGEILFINADGVLEAKVCQRINICGSFAATVSVRSFGNGYLEIAGSPAKFLQGHNAFGVDDLRSIGSAMIQRACARLNVALLESELHDIRAGHYDLKRVDINYSFLTGSRQNALDWIVKAAAVATLANRGEGKLYKGSTVIWGEGSREWKLKAYSKSQELAAGGHELPDALPRRNELLAWSEDKLRIELELHTRQLKKLGLERASSWAIGTSRELFRLYLAKLRMGEQAVLNSTQILQLPMCLRLTCCTWIGKFNLLQMMPRNKYYRHRRKLLLEHGINIGVPAQGELSTEIPLNQYLEKPCVDVPAWAVGTALYWQAGNHDLVRADGQSSITVRQRSGVTRILTGRRHGPAYSDRDDGLGEAA